MDEKTSHLSEVALTVQFEPLGSVTILDIAELYGKFREEFPIFQNAPRNDKMEMLPPNEATFSVTGSELPRSWFLRADTRELIQFQPDRFSYNWRRLGIDDIEHEYPRYDTIKAQFFNYYSVMSNWAFEKYRVQLKPNLAEIMYINQIPIPTEGNSIRLSSVLSFFKPTDSMKMANFKTMWNSRKVGKYNIISNSTAETARSTDGAPLLTLLISCRIDLSESDFSKGIDRELFDDAHSHALEVFNATTKLGRAS